MKTAIVTGSGSGIGRAVAMRLAGDGYRVTVNDIALDQAASVAAQIRSDGGEAIAVGGDVSLEDDVAAIVEACRKAFGDPTHLISNAGHVHQARFTELTPADFDRMFAVHVRGAFLMTRAVLPAMLARNAGVIVYTASQLGQIGGVELVHYSAAKAAIIESTQSRLAPSTRRWSERSRPSGERPRRRNFRLDGLANRKRSRRRSPFCARIRQACSSGRQSGPIPET
jgi:3-oxoacyl-[acyl-carrier protein] reductase